MAHIKELPKDKQIDIIASQEGSDTINVTSEKLSNEITHKDNIESNKDQIRKEKEEKIIQKVKDVSS